MSRSRREFLTATSAAAGGLVVVSAAGVGAGAGALTGARPAAASPAPWDQIPVILGRIRPPTFPDRTVDIRDHGAIGNGTADCTTAFRNAINACADAGGGRVLVPASGTYRTGKIHLRSNINLHVEAGARIRFRTDTGSFLPTVFTRWQGIECFNFSPFIYGFNLTNVALTGAGTIDGNAAAGPWFDMDPQRQPDWERLQRMAVDNVPINQRQFGGGHFLKPNMIQLYRCTNVLIADLDIRNSAMWAVHPVLCTNVTVRNIKVFTRGAMVDGCDPESCTDVHITSCQFDTGDDGIALKSGRDIDGRRVGAPTQNVVIENNRFLGRWGAVTVGSEMSGGVRNVFAQDNTIGAGTSYRSFHGIYIKTNRRRGGVVDGIHVRRLSGGPVDRGCVHIDMNYSLTGPGFGPIAFPVVRNVHIEDIRLNDSPYAIRINGIAESRMSHFHMTDCAFTAIDSPNPQISNATDVVLTNVTVNGRQIGDPAPPGTRYEAEDATISQGVVESTHTGFTGRGYVNLDNVTGCFVQWTVPAAAGPVTATIRFANGTTTNRPMDVAVNGSTVRAGQAFAGTGAWTGYATVSVPLTLAEGPNTIRLTATTAGGGPNLDSLTIR